MVKVIWKHKEQLVEELCRKANIRESKDKANVAKLTTSNLYSLLRALDSDFRPSVEKD